TTCDASARRRQTCFREAAQSNRSPACRSSSRRVRAVTGAARPARSIVHARPLARKCSVQIILQRFRCRLEHLYLLESMAGPQPNLGWWGIDGPLDDLDSDGLLRIRPTMKSKGLRRKRVALEEPLDHEQ